MRSRKPQRAAGAFVRGATDGPRIGSTEQLAKGSIRQSGDSHRRLPPVVSGLQHFHRLVSPATFPPTECLMAPVSYSPRAVRRGDEHRTWTSVPLRDALLGDWVLFRRRVPLLLSTGPGPSKQSLALARRGRGEMRRGQRRADRTGESASATWATKRPR